MDPVRKRLLSIGLGAVLLLVIVYLHHSGRLPVTQGGLMGAAMSLGYSARESGFWKKIRSPLASAVIKGLWFALLAYIVRFGSFKTLSIWLIAVAFGTGVIVAIAEAKLGRESPQVSCLLWTMTTFVLLLTNLTQTKDPTPLGPALFWSLFYGAITGIVRMFTLLPTGGMMKNEPEI